MKKYLYLASRKKEGGIYKYTFENGTYVQKSFIQIDSPMYMIEKDNDMHVLLRAPFENRESGYVKYKIGRDGDLCNPTQILSTKGEIACHLYVEGENVYCVNYTSGSVVKIPDKVVVHKGERQSHTHYVGATPDGKYLCITDLGLDAIYLYDKDLQLKRKVIMPYGHGVRHLCFTDNSYVFTANELKSTVSVLKYEDETLRLIDTVSCIPQGTEGFTAASAIRTYKNKIYVAIRGCNLISCLSFKDGKLRLESSFSCQGKTPRDFCFDEDRLICCNQDSDTATVFHEKGATFELIQTINIEEPMCALVH